VSDCRLTHNHCGPGATWHTSVEIEQFNLPQCCSELRSVSVTKTTTPVELCSLPHTRNQAPQDYTTGFLYPYTSDKWDAWLKRFSLQTNTSYKVCCGKEDSKESDTGVLNNGGKTVSPISQSKNVIVRAAYFDDRPQNGHTNENCFHVTSKEAAFGIKQQFNNGMWHWRTCCCSLQYTSGYIESLTSPLCVVITLIALYSDLFQPADESECHHPG